MRDDSISLVGFTTREEREVHRMLTTVSGLGLGLRCPSFRHKVSGAL